MKTDNNDYRGFLPKVNVLLSVYHPQPNWLISQIISVKNQANVEVNLQIRNDGFVQIDAALDDGLSKMEVGNHLGVGASYMELLSKCYIGGFGFCDQDDVWFSNKLSVKIQALKGLNSPAMAYCDFEIIDSESRRTGNRKSPKKISKFSFLFRNSIPGFSMYFNDEARKLLQESKSFFPQNGYHDWWSALAVSLLGSCVKVPEELASYRIHNKNTVGLASTQWGRFENVLNRINSEFNESRELLLKMIEFIEYKVPDHGSILFLKDIVWGMNLNRMKRLNILINHGVFRAPLSGLITSILFYVFPSKLRL